jgi:hypothetical protein
VTDLMQRVAQLKASAETKLKEIAKRWPADKPLKEIASLAHLFAMISRWEAQLQERFAALADA